LKDFGSIDKVNQEQHINGFDSNTRPGRDFTKKKSSLSITPSKHLKAAEKALKEHEHIAIYEKHKEARIKLLKSSRI